MRPTYMIFANGADITLNFWGRMTEIIITDQRGVVSDTLDISVDDHDGGVIWPSKDVKLQVFIGYREDQLYDHGIYVVDEINHTGPPDKVCIRARAPDLLDNFKGAKTRSFDKKTLGQIVQQIGTENGVPAFIGAELAGIMVEHVDQTQESDLHFLTRLAERYGAVAKVVDDKLIFVDAGKAETVSGAAMPVVPINRKQIDTHSYTEAGRTDYTHVEAVWHDRRTAKRKRAIAKAADGAKPGDRTVHPPVITFDEIEETEGIKGNAKRIKMTFPDKETAKAAAESEWKRMQRAKGTLQIDIKHGMPGLRAETKIPVSGIRPYVDGDWIATEVVHTLHGTSGLSTRVNLERPDDFVDGGEQQSV